MNVAYFVPEIAIDNDLHTYGGGLGVVAGDFSRAAGRQKASVVERIRRREKVSIVIVTILWRCGFYDQVFGPDGMEVQYNERYYNHFSDDTGVRVKIRLGENPDVLLKVWRLKENFCKTAPIYFLDADIPENDELSRLSTKILYSNQEREKLSQLIVLGIGGVRALQALGIPIDIYHLNEGYSVLAGIELICQQMAAGFSFEEALNQTRKQIVFTTHTSENTGNEELELSSMMEMGCFPGLSWGQAAFLGGEPFNTTVAALRLSRMANAVSKLHAETANRLWAWAERRCPIIPITNGVDVSFWQWPEFRGRKNPEEIRKAKLKYKRLLLDYIKEQTGQVFREDILTIVWARRFADYKRPGLIFCDYGWFVDLLNSGRVQIIYAGKPHPADWQMRWLYNHIWQMSQELPNLVVLAGYELAQSKLLKGGADLWLNTPRRPHEACSTSWISAMLNGTLVSSSRDGGALEGITEDNGFLFGVDYSCQNTGEQDVKDFQDLREVLGGVEIFYEDKKRWYQIAQMAKKTAEQNFSSDRMLADYIQKLYSYRDRETN